MDENKQELIDRYLLDEMTEEERRVFEALLEKEEELREQYVFTKQVRTALRSRLDKLSAMQAWESELADWNREQGMGCTMAEDGDHGNMADDPMEEEVLRQAAALWMPKRMAQSQEGVRYSQMAAPHSPSPAAESEQPVAKKRRRPAYWLTGALSAAAVVAVCFLVFRPSTVEMPALDMATYQSYRTGGAVSEIAALIEQKDYATALRRIETEEKALATNDADFLKNSDNLSEEERERLDYERQAANLDRDELKWLKVYALIGLERKQEAVTLLHEISHEDGPHREEAEKLYEKLK